VQMTDVGCLIESGEALTRFFGRWPSFHDAEILEVHLDRGHVEPEKNLYEFPSLTLKIHLWEMTKEVDHNGYFILRNHTLATLKLSDLDRLNLVGFNHQNAIMEMEIHRRERTDGPSPYFEVEIVPAFGFAASFICLHVTVVEAMPCNPDGTSI
jgi:hypothetical protein